MVLGIGGRPQRRRQKAQSAGNLKTNEQIKVSTQAPAPAPAPTTVVVQQSAPPPQVIVIEPAQPSVVYVPAYNPTVVYGPWPYPAYPPHYYPPPPGYFWSGAIATGIAWGMGIGISNALRGDCNWGRGDTPYRGGNTTKQNLDKKHQSGNREQYRSKDGSRDASRERATPASLRVAAR